MKQTNGTRAKYGVDAPGVVRNLFVAAVVCLGAWGLITAGLWGGVLRFGVGGVDFIFPVAPAGLCAGLGCLVTGTWMLWSSKTGKIRDRERMLDLLTWKGNEIVLDLGCGRGLLLIGAAKRLTTGKATGVDIWQSADLSGNSRDATMENARREGVIDRVAVENADMRKLPFDDGTFDVIVSRAAIHNLYSADDRRQAIAEAARVLKAGGHALIEDIRHHHEYAEALARNGCVVTGRAGSRVTALIASLITMGTIRPFTLLVKKSF